MPPKTLKPDFPIMDFRVRIVELNGRIIAAAFHKDIEVVRVSGDSAQEAEQNIREELITNFSTRKRKSKSGGHTPTQVRFRTDDACFPTAKEAYVWLMGKFLWDKPDVLADEAWMKDFVAHGQAANYFARSLVELFPASPHLASDPNMYTRLGRGWFANLNLSNKQKFSILSKFSAVAGYTFETDWDWRVEGEETPKRLKDLMS